MSSEYWHTGGTSGLFVRAAFRTLQFVVSLPGLRQPIVSNHKAEYKQFAIIVTGLYGVDLRHSTATKTHSNSAWVFAELVAGLSIITCIIHCFVTVKRVSWCAWDWLLFILWIAQFGVFGNIYISSNHSEDEFETLSVVRMKVAVWFDGINALLWFVTALSGIIWCCTASRVTRGTSREAFEEEAKGAFRPSPKRNLEEKVELKDCEDSTLNSNGKGNRDPEFRDFDQESKDFVLKAVDSMELVVGMIEHQGAVMPKQLA